MGFMKFSEVVYKMENFFDVIRNGFVEVMLDVVDFVFEFIEVIEEMINNIEEMGKEGDVDVDEFFEKVNVLLKGYIREKGVKKVEEEKLKVFFIEEGFFQSQEVILMEVFGNVYYVKVIFYLDVQLRGVRVFLIFCDLEEIGEVFEIKLERLIIEDGFVDVDELEFKVVIKVFFEEIKKFVGRYFEIKDVIVMFLEEGILKFVKIEEGIKIVEEQFFEGGGIILRIFLEKDVFLKGIRSFLVFQEIEKRVKVFLINLFRFDIQNGDFIDGYYFEVMFVFDVNLDEIKEVVLKYLDVVGVEVVEFGLKLLEKFFEVQGIQVEVKKFEVQLKLEVKKQFFVFREKIKMLKLIKVDVFYLDKLMNFVGELVINKGRFEQIVECLGDREFIEIFLMILRLMVEFQDEIMQMCFILVVEVFNKFLCMVRSLVRKEGKEVEFIMEGIEIEVDRIILDKFGDVFVYFLRNVIDYGIELLEEREREVWKIV